MLIRVVALSDVIPASFFSQLRPFFVAIKTASCTANEDHCGLYYIMASALSDLRAGLSKRRAPPKNLEEQDSRLTDGSRPAHHNPLAQQRTNEVLTSVDLKLLEWWMEGLGRQMGSRLTSHQLVTTYVVKRFLLKGFFKPQKSVYNLDNRIQVPKNPSNFL